jgi:hypothetical protein
MRAQIGFGAAVVAFWSLSIWVAPVSHAEGGWVAVANSPGHEQQDWSIRPDQASAESAALAQCALLQRASDCRIVASGPDCVATAWDAAQPINQLHAASGGGPEVVVRAAMMAAGPTANDPAVRCSWSA